MNTTEADIRKTNRVHTVYKNSRGVRVPSVTTVLNHVQIGGKPRALKYWAWGLGKAGVDMDAYVDELAGVGTLAHRMILDHHKGEKTDTNAYSHDQIDLAENCFLKYLTWEKAHTIKPLLVETPLVSTLHGYGGTPDFLGIIDGALTLVDFKTGKPGKDGAYPDYWYQLGGYYGLLDECRYVEQYGAIVSFKILNIGRNETEQFQEDTRDDVSDEMEVFLHALAIYKLTR